MSKEENKNPKITIEKKEAPQLDIPKTIIGLKSFNKAYKKNLKSTEDIFDLERFRELVGALGNIFNAEKKEISSTQLNELFPLLDHFFKNIERVSKNKYKPDTFRSKLSLKLSENSNHKNVKALKNDAYIILRMRSVAHRAIDTINRKLNKFTTKSITQMESEILKQDNNTNEVPKTLIQSLNINPEFLTLKNKIIDLYEYKEKIKPYLTPTVNRQEGEEELTPLNLAFILFDLLKDKMINYHKKLPNVLNKVKLNISLFKGKELPITPSESRKKIQKLIDELQKFPELEKELSESEELSN